jgi:hypothetical protein
MLLALALGSLAAPLSAQLSELTVGARVRIRAPEVVAGRLTGVIIARGADTLTVTRASATPLTLRVSQLSTVEISRGRSHGRGAARGALWGGGVMAVLGVAFVDGATTCEGSGGGASCRETTAVESAAYGALSGALVGGIIGAFVGREHWERLSLPRVAVAPVRAGALRVALTWGW